LGDGHTESIRGKAMAKKKVFENYRVEVAPAEIYWRAGEKGEKSEHALRLKELKHIRQSIERHVDDIESISEKWDTREICEFCGSDWEIWEEEDEKEEGGYKKGMPVCCEKTQKEFESNARES
jgi:hypothetical protein